MGTELDLRDVPPPERHPRIHDAFADLDPGESLTLVNDHDPRPLFYEMQAEVPAFDADGYCVERRGPTEYVATLPKESAGAGEGGDPATRTPGESEEPDGTGDGDGTGDAAGGGERPWRR
jgi:uncharacterized protein (DUF2249 family)